MLRETYADYGVELQRPSMIIATEVPQESVESCPFCERWLVKVQRPSGIIAINEQATATVFTEPDPAHLRPLGINEQLVPGSARCLRPLCRLRAWRDAR